LFLKGVAIVADEATLTARKIFRSGIVESSRSARDDLRAVHYKCSKPLPKTDRFCFADQPNVLDLVPRSDRHGQAVR